ncbi:asr8042 (plasmid) [Nostoc sp. PCC 7120 = FACHB-418]|nr:asr8042 [Nostoc sp. PCC 7120 = FACHB-418]
MGIALIDVPSCSSTRVGLLLAILPNLPELAMLIKKTNIKIMVCPIDSKGAKFISLLSSNLI